MADFTPGVERAKKAGYKIDVQPYVGTGEQQVRQSLQVIARKIRDGRLDPDVRGWAGDTLIAAGKPSSTTGKVQALLDAFRQSTVYVADPVGAEYIATAVATACLRPGLCVRARDCIPEGTKLLRDDFALVPIEEIKPGDRIWGRDQWTVVSDVWAKGELAVDALELNSGSTVFLTGDHKVYVGRCKHGNGADCWCSNCHRPAARRETYERVNVSELLEGDVLLRPDRIAFGTGEVDPDRAYVEGLALADGWVDMPSGRSFRIAGRDGKRKEAQKHEVKAICDRLGIETLWHRRYITVKDPAWAQRLLTLGSRARFKHAETLNLTEAGAKELLRGLMADSTKNSNGLGRTYSTTSYTMMVQVRVLQRMFGVTTGVKMLTPEEHGGAGEFPLWRVYVRAGTQKAEKTLAVRAIDRKARVARCWDLTTEDHYVYLPEHDVTVSNCDDGVVFMGSALLSIGIPARVLKQNFGAGKQEHVLVEAQLADGSWVPVDPSTALSVGDKVPAVHELRLDPMDQVGSAGTSGPEIVSLGSIPDLPPRDVRLENGRWTERRYGQWWVHEVGVGWAPVGSGDACCAACAEGKPCGGETDDAHAEVEVVEAVAEVVAVDPATSTGTAKAEAEPDPAEGCSSCEAYAAMMGKKGKLKKYGVSAPPNPMRAVFAVFDRRMRRGVGAPTTTTTTTSDTPTVSPIPATLTPITPTGAVGVGTVVAFAAVAAVAGGLGYGFARRWDAQCIHTRSRRSR